MTEVHVVPEARTTWRVYESDAAVPRSEHTSATEAQLAARAHTRDRDAERVGIRDRYYRTHDAAPSPSGVSRHLPARARSAASARGARR
jgi:hypothetical protein